LVKMHSCIREDSYETINFRSKQSISSRNSISLLKI
jgi:hypothetical protein